MADAAGSGAEGDGAPPLPVAADAAAIPIQHATVEYVADAPLTAEQARKVSDLRALVAPSLPALHATDGYWGGEHALRRVLVARGWNVDAAARMHKEIVAFRAARSSWRFLGEPGWYAQPEVMRRYFPWGFAGVDREGFPVLVERIGAIDLIGIHAAVGTEDFLTWVCW